MEVTNSIVDLPFSAAELGFPESRHHKYTTPLGSISVWILAEVDTSLPLYRKSHDGDAYNDHSRNAPRAQGEGVLPVPNPPQNRHKPSTLRTASKKRCQPNDTITAIKKLVGRREERRSQ